MPTHLLSPACAERRLGAPFSEGGSYVADNRKSEHVNSLLKVRPSQPLDTMDILHLGLRQFIEHAIPLSPPL